MELSKLYLPIILRVVRAIKGCSQKELAKEIGISTPTLSRYERGDIPSSEIIKRGIEELIGKIEEEAEKGILNEDEKKKIEKKKEKKKKRKQEDEWKT